MVGLARAHPHIAALFNGSPHGPAPIVADEPGAMASTVPSWLLPMLAPLLDAEEEQTKLLERAPLDLRVNRLKAERDPVLAQLPDGKPTRMRSEEHKSEIQTIMRISYAVFCLKKKTKQKSQKY